MRIAAISLLKINQSEIIKKNLHYDMRELLPQLQDNQDPLFSKSGAKSAFFLPQLVEIKKEDMRKNF